MATCYNMVDPGQGRTALILQDNLNLSMEIEAAAVACGYQPSAIAHSRQFYPEYKHVRPSVIVLELYMDEVDGLELTRWLVSENNRAPVILTASGNILMALAAQKFAENAGKFELLIAPQPPRTDHMKEMFDVATRIIEDAAGVIRD